MVASFSAFASDLPSIALIVLHSLEGSVMWSSVSTNCLHAFLRCSFVVLVILSFSGCTAGKVGSLDLKSSCGLILSNISAATSSVLVRCHPEGICRDDGTQDLFSFFVVCWKPSFAQFILYLLTMGYRVDSKVHLQVTTIIVRKMIKHEQRRKYCAIL